MKRYVIAHEDGGVTVVNAKSGVAAGRRAAEIGKVKKMKDVTDVVKAPSSMVERALREFGFNDPTVDFLMDSLRAEDALN